MRNTIDLHLHTVVSDGEITPEDILNCAKEIGLKTISITDHDAIGGYKNFDSDPIKLAWDMGIRLITGIELDSDYEDVEIHILGYEIDLHNEELNNYITGVHTLRKKRIIEQIEQINNALGEEILNKDEILIGERDTYMKPHLVRPLLKKGLFSEYREASKWVSGITKPSVSIPKSTAEDMIGLIKRAGGKAYLAHPGYYVCDNNLDLDKMLTYFISVGLDGMEVEYPYYNTGVTFRTRESEKEIIKKLGEKAKKYGLLISRGSDAHELAQMKSFHESW